MIKKIKRFASRFTWTDLLFALSLLIGILLVQRKIRYGLGLTNDESFYLSMPWRFLQGDAFVSDEWNMSQTSSFLLMPIVALYKLFFRGTDGIVLWMRYIYVIGHAMCSVFLYARLRRYGWAAAFAAVLHFMFIPYTIKAWSYNTMAVDLLAAGCALMATTEKRSGFFISGLMFAGAVLCCPFLAAAWFLYALCVLWARLKHHPKMLDVPMFRGSSFLMVTAACAVLALLFLAMVASRLDISRLEGALPFIFSDTDHDTMTLAEHFGEYITDIATACSQGNYYYTGVFGLFLLLLVLIGLDRNRMQRRAVYLASGAMLSLCANVLFACMLSSYHQAMMFPLIFAGLPAYILLKDKPRALFASFVGVGVLYSMADHLASNNHFLVVAMAFAVVNIGSILFIAMLIREMREESTTDAEARARANGAAILCVLSMAFLLFYRVETNSNVSFLDSAPYLNHTRIEQGPAKGVITSEAYAEFYDQRYNDLQLIQAYGPGGLCVLSEDCWPYLMLHDYPAATYSSWFPDEDLEKISAWWDLHPDRMPDYILIPIYYGTPYSFYGLCSASISEEGNLNAFENAGYTRLEGQAYHIFIRTDIYEAQQH